MVAHCCCHRDQREGPPCSYLREIRMFGMWEIFDQSFPVSFLKFSSTIGTSAISSDSSVVLRRSWSGSDFNFSQKKMDKDFTCGMIVISSFPKSHSSNCSIIPKSSFSNLGKATTDEDEDEDDEKVP